MCADVYMRRPDEGLSCPLALLFLRQGLVLCLHSLRTGITRVSRWACDKGAGLRLKGNSGLKPLNHLCSFLFWINNTSQGHAQMESSENVPRITPSAIASFTWVENKSSSKRDLADRNKPYPTLGSFENLLIITVHLSMWPSVEVRGQLGVSFSFHGRYRGLNSGHATILADLGHKLSGRILASSF